MAEREGRPLQLDLGSEIGKVIGLMAQLRAWAQADGQLTELGVDDGDAALLQRVEKLLTDRFHSSSRLYGHLAVKEN